MNREEVTAEEQTVHARLEDLHPGTTYFYRLEAKNMANGHTNAGEESQDRSFTTTGPNIEHESVLEVTGTTASFDATIFPNHAPTSYYVQYSTADTSGCEATVSISSCPTVPALPGEAIGAGVEPVTTPSQAVTGLSPATLYHYRVIALSELQPGQQTVFEGPDETFTTQGAGAFTLPDHRQWEMVSPPDKHGALINPIVQEGLVQAAAAGDAITYNANQPTEPDPEGSSNEVQVYSAREPDGGWRTRDIELPHPMETAKPEQTGEQYRFFSEDLSLAVVNPAGDFDPVLSPEASEQTAFLRTDYLHGDVDEPCLPASMSCYRPLVSGCLTEAEYQQNVPREDKLPVECARTCANTKTCRKAPLFGVGDSRTSAPLVRALVRRCHAGRALRRGRTPESPKALS